MSATIEAEWEPTRNQLLAALAPDDRYELMHDVQRVQLEPCQVLVVQGDPVRHVYFLLGGMCALVVVMRGGRMVLASAVGNEGLVGVSAVVGPDRSPVEAVCQAPGAALRVPAEALRHQWTNRSGLRKTLFEYVSRLLAQTQRNAACNCLHDVEPRLARWLLVVSDRTGTPGLPLTQELMSAILGVRRASVSKAAAALQTIGTIRCRRGHVSIVDRLRLETVACECYRATQA